MRYFIDTEFIERGPHYPIQLISIGIVCEDGREFYAESSEYDKDSASNWVRENVFPRLVAKVPVSLKEMANKIFDFISCTGQPPQFWAYYADYDWVVFCQIFGSMVDLPTGWPMYCRDIKQWYDDLDNPPRLPSHGDGEHNALDNARWNMRAWKVLNYHSKGLNRCIVPK